LARVRNEHIPIFANRRCVNSPCPSLIQRNFVSANPKLLANVVHDTGYTVLEPYNFIGTEFVSGLDWYRLLELIGKKANFAVLLIVAEIEDFVSNLFSDRIIKWKSCVFVCP